MNIFKSGIPYTREKVVFASFWQRNLTVKIISNDTVPYYGNGQKYQTNTSMGRVLRTHVLPRMSNHDVFFFWKTIDSHNIM